MLLSGCVSMQHKQVHDEIDLIGIEATTPDILNYGTATSIKVGIMHIKHFSNPTATNPVYAAPYKYNVNADIGALHQTVTNSFSTLP